MTTNGLHDCPAPALAYRRQIVVRIPNKLAMKTVSLQIGNGDDKLSQSQWHQFVIDMKELVERHCEKLHFFGAPETWRDQQNVAFIFELDDDRTAALQAEVTKLRARFEQESAAWMEGKTLFI